MISLGKVYRVLADVYTKGSWIGEAIDRQGLSAEKGALRLIYGVVEREQLYEYRIGRLTDRAPKTSVKVLLKMGMCLLDTFDLADHSAVNAIAETAKKVGKGAVGGFINAVLRRYATEGGEMYPTDPDELLAVRSDRPLWLVKRYISELGRERAEKRLIAPMSAKTHIRPAFAFGQGNLLAVLVERAIPYEETPFGCYIGEVGKVSDLIRDGRVTVMSRSSIEVAASLPYLGGEILDLAAAPGGKSVWLAEHYGADVIAADRYEHRVALIGKYAARMHVSTVRPTVWDGTILREDWIERFSSVLLDAPCSGLGSIPSNPDVLIHRKEEDLTEIIRLQHILILRAAEYVTTGGSLLYATCSDLPSENEAVVRALLEERDNFTLEKEKYTDPTEGGGESYYYALLRKK